MRDNCPQSRSSAVLVSIGSIRAASLFFMRHVHNKAALKQYPTDCMLTYQVSTRVNSPPTRDLQRFHTPSVGFRHTELSALGQGPSDSLLTESDRGLR